MKQLSFSQKLKVTIILAPCIITALYIALVIIFSITSIFSGLFTDTFGVDSLCHECYSHHAPNYDHTFIK